MTPELGEPLAAQQRPARGYFEENGPGLLASGLAHAIALLILLLGVRTAMQPSPGKLRVLMIDVIHLGEATTSPPAPQKSVTAQQQAPVLRAPRAHSPPVGVRPAKTRPPPDDLQNRLNALSKLRAPETDPRILNGTGDTAAETASNGAAPGDASYSLRDFVRAQIERKWNLDLRVPGARAMAVSLHVVMTANGTIASAEITDRHRYAVDAAFHQIALSARNAVLLASPIALPPGDYPPETTMTLLLRPSDALR